MYSGRRCRLGEVREPEGGGGTACPSGTAAAKNENKPGSAGDNGRQRAAAENARTATSYQTRSNQNRRTKE